MLSFLSLGADFLFTLHLLSCPHESIRHAFATSLCLPHHYPKSKSLISLLLMSEWHIIKYFFFFV